MKLNNAHSEIEREVDFAEDRKLLIFRAKVLCGLAVIHQIRQLLFWDCRPYESLASQKTYLRSRSLYHLLTPRRINQFLLAWISEFLYLCKYWTLRESCYVELEACSSINFLFRSAYQLLMINEPHTTCIQLFIGTSDSTKNPLLINSWGWKNVFALFHTAKISQIIHRWMDENETHAILYYPPRVLKGTIAVFKILENFWKI